MSLTTTAPSAPGEVVTPPRRAPRAGVAATNAERAGWLLVWIAVLAVMCVLSIVIGTKHLALGTIWDAFVHPGGSGDHAIIRELRVPRTLLGVLVGVALGVAGAVIQAVTRNPLADTQILGVNAGAGLFVVAAIGAVRPDQRLVVRLVRVPRRRGGDGRGLRAGGRSVAAG